MLNAILVLCWLSDHPKFYGGYELSWEGQAAVVTCDVPRDLFEHAKSPTWLDVGVINGNGELMAHAIKVHALEPPELKWQAIELWSVPSTKPETMDRISLFWKSSEKKEVGIVGIRSTSSEDRDYLCDLGEEPKTYDHLRCEIPSDFQGIGRIEVWGSGEMDRWTFLGDGALAMLGSGDHSIHRNQFVVNTRGFRYLNLKSPIVPLMGLNLAYMEHPQPQLKWLPAIPFSAEDEEALRYQVSGYPPLAAVRLVFSEANTSARFNLTSQQSEDVLQTHRVSGFAYRLLTGETDDESALRRGSVADLVSDHHFDWTTDPIWWLHLDSQWANIGAEMPALQFAVLPVSLRFIPRGPKPFYLVVGSNQVTQSTRRPWDQLLPSELQGLPSATAHVKDFQRLAGDQAHVSIREEIDWERIVLWSVLIAAVLVIFVLSWRLMTPNKDEQGPSERL